MKKLITAQEFEEAFRSQWEEDRCSRELEIKHLIKKCWNKPVGPWTKFMLEENEPFFYRVLQKLEREDMGFCYGKGSAAERYRLDCAYHHCKSFYEDYDYPFCMDVLIEHENDKYIEEEMWRLLMVRSPLKVLVCYDVLKNKLDELAYMARRVDKNWQEAEETEYLIIIGRRNSTSDDVIWDFKKLKNYRWVNNS